MTRIMHEMVIKKKKENNWQTKRKDKGCEGEFGITKK